MGLREVTTVPGGVGETARADGIGPRMELVATVTSPGWTFMLVWAYGGDIGTCVPTEYGDGYTPPLP